MAINIERLLDTISEAYDATNDYCRESIKYRKNHFGCGAYFDLAHGMNAEKEKLYYRYQSDSEMHRMLWYLFDILDLDRDQIDRAYKATRAIRRWYESTKWERCPSEDMINALGRYIIG